MIDNFDELDAWKIGHEFVIAIYKTTKLFPRDEVYGLTAQLRRAAVSITSNIAEGFSRYSYKDKTRFFYNARGSISECQNQLQIARDIEYLSKEEAGQLISLGGRARQILNGLIRSTESQIKNRNA